MPEAVKETTTEQSQVDVKEDVIEKMVCKELNKVEDASSDMKVESKEDPAEEKVSDSVTENSKTAVEGNGTANHTEEASKGEPTNGTVQPTESVETLKTVENSNEEKSEVDNSVKSKDVEMSVEGSASEEDAKEVKDNDKSPEVKEPVAENNIPAQANENSTSAKETDNKSEATENNQSESVEKSSEVSVEAQSNQTVISASAASESISVSEPSSESTSTPEETKSQDKAEPSAESQTISEATETKESSKSDSMEVSDETMSDKAEKITEEPTAIPVEAEAQDNKPQGGMEVDEMETDSGDSANKASAGASEMEAKPAPEVVVPPSENPDTAEGKAPLTVSNPKSETENKQTEESSAMATETSAPSESVPEAKSDSDKAMEVDVGGVDIKDSSETSEQKSVDPDISSSTPKESDVADKKKEDEAPHQTSEVEGDASNNMDSEKSEQKSAEADISSSKPKESNALPVDEKIEDKAPDQTMEVEGEVGNNTDSEKSEQKSVEADSSSNKSKEPAAVDELKKNEDESSEKANEPADDSIVSQSQSKSATVHLVCDRSKTTEKMESSQATDNPSVEPKPEEEPVTKASENDAHKKEECSDVTKADTTTSDVKPAGEGSSDQPKTIDAENVTEQQDKGCTGSVVPSSEDSINQCTDGQAVTKESSDQSEVAAGSSREIDPKIVEEIAVLMRDAKCHMSTADYFSAADLLGKACEIAGNLYGDLAVENAELFYLYGCAMLECAKNENPVLGEGVKEKDESEEEVENNDTEAVEDEKMEVDEAESTNKDESEKEKSVESSAENAIQTTIEAGNDESSKAADGTETTKEGEEEEDDSSLKVAWDMFELAKCLFQKLGNDLRLSETYIKLGEVGMESGHSSAIDDMKNALDIRKKCAGDNDRLIAETHFHIGLAHATFSQFDEAIAAFNVSKSLIQKRIDGLKEAAKEESNAEIKELSDLIPDLDDKIQDMEDSKKAKLKAEEEQMPGTEVASCSNKPVSNISHLVKRKRKLEEVASELPSSKQPCKEPKTEDESPAPKPEDAPTS